MIYLYAITRACSGAGGELRGIDDEPVRVQTCGELAGWFTRDASVPRSAELRHALRHEQVVEAIMQRTAVLPMRLWTTLPDQTDLMRLLDRNAHQFAAGLHKVTGCLELGVRILCTESATHGPAIDHSSGRAYMAARAAEERERVQL